MDHRPYDGWEQGRRPGAQRIKVRRRYWFVCEGLKTERLYFEGLEKHKVKLGISPGVYMQVSDKGGENKSSPKSLLEYADGIRKQPDFNPDIDRVVIVFDYDVFEKGAPGYEDILNEIESNGDESAVTNPNFELFLLLHQENSYKDFIEGNEERFLTDADGKKIGSFDHALTILKDIGRLRSNKPKSDPGIGDFPKDALVAIAQEKEHINENIRNINGKVTCNVGMMIEEIMSEKLPY